MVRVCPPPLASTSQRPCDPRMNHRPVVTPSDTERPRVTRLKPYAAGRTYRVCLSLCWSGLVAPLAACAADSRQTWKSSSERYGERKLASDSTSLCASVTADSSTRSLLKRSHDCKVLHWNYLSKWFIDYYSHVSATLGNRKANKGGNQQCSM